VGAAINFADVKVSAFDSFALDYLAYDNAAYIFADLGEFFHFKAATE
jgi:hypothetical protein